MIELENDAQLNPSLPLEVSVSSENLNEAVIKLTSQLKKELGERENLHKKNRNIYLWLSISSIAFTCLATIFGIIGNIDSGREVEISVNGEEVQTQESQPTFLGIQRTDFWKFLTPICTTIAATLQGAVLGFPVQQRAKFHRLLEAKTDSLQSELEIQQFLGITPNYLQEMSQKLSQLKIEGSQEDGESNKEISTLTLEQINASIAKMTEIKAELEKLKQQKQSNSEKLQT